GIVMRFQGKTKEFSAGYRLTTNNRMELLAVIVALEQLKTKQYPIKVVSDSKYVIDAINLKWVYGWKLKGFKGKKNSDLWMRFLKVSEGFNIDYVWVRGHNGHPENERCDELAVNASLAPSLLIDTFYEEIENDSASLF
ncbi:MAG: ribonuclease HI, partial [Crocinitomicaceae bacterium]|nr:ribonuclease HI [Crocinitomicaceae bacterium]